MFLCCHAQQLTAKAQGGCTQRGGRHPEGGWHIFHAERFDIWRGSNRASLGFEIAQSAACLIRLAISLRLLAANKAFNLRAFAIELSE